MHETNQDFDSNVLAIATSIATVLGCAVGAYYTTVLLDLHIFVAIPLMLLYIVELMSLT